ncbi:MAG: M81 family metallopeptidase [Planctomycetota bacterium]
MSGRPLRLAFARIAQETNSFSPVPSTLEDFTRLHWREGQDLLRACGRLRAEVPGLIRNAELSGFVRGATRAAGRELELVPLFSAWAMPSGPLTEAAYLELRERLRAELRAAGPLDGVYLALHGAMRAQGAQPDPEVGFLAATREVIGPDLPLVVSMDLHGLLVPGKVDPTTLLLAYRTNPHRDLAQIGNRAGRLLVRAARGEVQPVVRWRSLPMLLGGGLTIDLLAPMRSIFQRMKAMERDPRVLGVSLFMAHPFNDSPDLGWSVHVVTDGDEALADELADELAERAWAVRDVPLPKFLSPEEGIEAVRRARVARRLGTVCVVDTSDVVGAGSTGENTNMVRALLAHGAGLSSYVPVRAPEVVLRLWDTPLGERVTATVGGVFDQAHNPPLEVTGVLRARKTTVSSGRAVLLDLGHVQLVVTELPPLPLKPGFYGELGLSCWKADLVVVKNFFHYRIYFLAHSRKSVAIRTQGATDFDLPLAQRYADPVHPKDEVPDWRPADRRRRGLAPLAAV